MTVAALIEELQKLDPNLETYVFDPYQDFLPIGKVKEDEDQIKEDGNRAVYLLPDLARTDT